MTVKNVVKFVFAEHFSGTKNEPKSKLLSPIFSGGVGAFHVKGWGPKSSVCPSKPRESNFFGGISRDFAGISRKRPKSLRKKCLGSIFGPYFKARFLLFLGKTDRKLATLVA